MIRISDRDRESLRLIWNTHLAGDTVPAAKMASEALHRAERAKNPNDELIAELTQQVVVLSHAAALQQRLLTAAFPYLLKSVRTMERNYPFGPDAESAKKKSALWNDVYGGNGVGHVETLRTSLQVAASVEALLSGKSQYAEDSEGLQRFMTNLQEILRDYAFQSENPPQVAWMDLIESGDYPSAAAFFTKMVDLYEMDEDKVQTDRLITVSARFLNRAFREGDMASVTQAAGVLKELVRGDWKRLPQAARDLLKAVKGRQGRYGYWQHQLSRRPEVFEIAQLTEPLAEMQYFFGANGRAIPVR